MLTEIEIVHNRIHMDRLVKRRDRITARLTELDAQLRQLEMGALTYDEKAAQSQRNSLTYLANFHHTEIDQVDSALSRMATGRYGVCLACNGRVEPDWLDSFPEAEFCSTCYRIRERMGAG
jgi:RNA polymerase-binding transcription factor DksA